MKSATVLSSPISPCAFFPNEQSKKQGYLSYQHALSPRPTHPIFFSFALYTTSLFSIPPSQGYLSYPRTESSAYPPNFDHHVILSELTRSPTFGQYAHGLVSNVSVIYIVLQFHYNIRINVRE
jgi:hypothetical protein